VLASLVTACGRTNSVRSTSEINVATAANLTRAFGEVGQAFEGQTGIHVTYSFGATTQLAQQIEHGAPYDVFAAADIEHVDQLARKGFLIPETRGIYARGKLVLWVPDNRVPVDAIQDLTRAEVKQVAIANAQLAPYGQAAVETLKNLRIWNAIQPKVVFAQNVSMATQYAATRNADAAFTALALVYDQGGRKIQIAENLHQPIDQAIAVVRGSRKPAEARKFVAFVLSAPAKQILKRYGYE
jgi:molybdate transport system substrate-binding protein